MSLQKKLEELEHIPEKIQFNKKRINRLNQRISYLEAGRLIRWKKGKFFYPATVEYLDELHCRLGEERIARNYVDTYPKGKSSAKMLKLLEKVSGIVW